MVIVNMAFLLLFFIFWRFGWVSPCETKPSIFHLLFKQIGGLWNLYKLNGNNQKDNLAVFQEFLKNANSAALLVYPSGPSKRRTHTKLSYFLNMFPPNNSVIKYRRASQFCPVVSFGILCNILSLVFLSNPEKQTAYVDQNDHRYKSVL